jgi:hypothetical protein
MNIAQFQIVLDTTPKGANVSLEWERKVTTLAAFKNVDLRKRVTMSGRIGVEYDNMQKTIEGRENGTLPAVNAGMKGKDWIIYPFLSMGKNGPLVRFTPNTNSNARAKSVYFLNGKEIDKSHIENMLPASSFNPPAVFDVKLEDILKIHKVEVVEETMANA